MKLFYIRHVLFIGACLLLSNCEKNIPNEKIEKAEIAQDQKTTEPNKDCLITGSVFIVAKDATNYKMGLIPILISDPSSIDNHIKKVFEQLYSDCASDIQKYKEALKSLEETHKKFSSLSGLTKAAESSYNNALSSLEEVADVSSAAREVRKNEDSDYGAYRRLSREFVSATEKYERLLVELEPILEKMMSNEMANRYVESSIKGTIDDHLSNVFSNIPHDNQLVTDADGNFEIKLPRNEEIIITGKGKRAVGNDTEHYYWLKKIIVPDENNHKILFSNNDLVKSIPSYSEKLITYMPDNTNDLSKSIIELQVSLSFELSKIGKGETWVFRPVLRDDPKTGRTGNAIILGSRMSADVLEESGSVIGLTPLEAGETIEIQREDEDYFYFSGKGKFLRLKKSKLADTK